MLKARGIDLIAADSPTAFLDDGPTAVLVRQMLGAVAQFEKSMLVSKLKGARDRKKATGVKVDGRKSHAEASGGRQAGRSSCTAPGSPIARSLLSCRRRAT